MVNFLRMKSAQMNEAKEKILKSENPIQEIFDSEGISDKFNEKHKYRKRFYTPIKTLIAFTKQCFSKEKQSCLQAVADIVAEEASSGNTLSSATGAYSNARERLSNDAMKSVMSQIDNIANEIPEIPYMWHDMHVKLLDGTTVQMTDTKSNQLSFPQHGNQKEGSGFPIARIVVLMSLSTGTVIDYSIAPYKGKLTGEHALFREIHHHICDKTLLLGDSYYPSYFLMAELVGRSANGIFKALAARDNEKYIIENIGSNDNLVCWERPKRKPDWMTLDEYNLFPTSIKLRLIKVDGNLYITTLISKKYHKKEIAKLYKERWNVEVNLRSIKTFMGMEELHCKSPDMVKKEITSHFIAYNIIRLIMVKSAILNGCKPNELSFMNAMNQIESFWVFIMLGDKPFILWLAMLNAISSIKIGKRPNRFEPRVVKRRSKSFPKMSGKRSDYPRKIA